MLFLKYTDYAKEFWSKHMVVPDARLYVSFQNWRID